MELLSTELAIVINPNIPKRIGDVIKPIIAQMIPIIPHANCLLIMAIMPNSKERGTNTGARKNILITPNMNEAIPNALLVFFSIIILCTVSGLIDSFELFVII